MAFLFLLACSMGSSSSLYSVLAKTVSRPPLPCPCDSTYTPGNDLDLDQDPADPLELLRECREVLRNRPAQLQRAFVQTGHGDSGQTIRVMQWNVLAQGINLNPIFIFTKRGYWMTYYLCLTKYTLPFKGLGVCESLLWLQRLHLFDQK